MRVGRETKKAMTRRSASKPPSRIVTTPHGDVKHRFGYVLPEPIHIGIAIDFQQVRELGVRITASRGNRSKSTQLSKRHGRCTTDSMPFSATS